MKAFFKISISILCIAIAGVIVWAAIKFAFPYLQAKSQYEKDYPSIVVLQSDIESRNHEIDSLTNRVQYLEQQVDLQNRLIEERNLQSTISRQLKNLQKTYNEAKH